MGGCPKGSYGDTLPPRGQELNRGNRDGTGPKKVGRVLEADSQRTKRDALNGEEAKKAKSRWVKNLSLPDRRRGYRGEGSHDDQIILIPTATEINTQGGAIQKPANTGWLRYTVLSGAFSGQPS